MKILVLGSNGLLGSSLCASLKNEHEIIAWDRPQIDVTNKEEVFQKINMLHPEHIINATAINAVDEIESTDAMFELAKKVNNEAVGVLAAAANSISSTITHFSTDYVFSGRTIRGYDENDATDPINKYGETKANGERELQKNTSKFYLIRLSRLFGQSSLNVNSKKSFVDLIVDKAANVKELSLVCDEVSCQTYSKDLSGLVGFILNKKMPYGIYHGANAGAASWFEFAEEIFKIKKIQISMKPIQSEELHRAAKRPRYSVLLNTKLPQLRPWQEALQEYLVS